jgi:hypothetical protein
VTELHFIEKTVKINVPPPPQYLLKIYVLHGMDYDYSNQKIIEIKEFKLFQRDILQQTYTGETNFTCPHYQIFISSK